MDRRLSRLWSTDAWSDVVEERLGRLYASADIPAVRARRLCTALTINYLAARPGQATLFVYVPCTSYDEALAFDSLVQLASCTAWHVFPVLVLPDQIACEAAIHRAARDNLSRLMYFFEGSASAAAMLSPEGSRLGSHLVLASGERLGDETLASIARNNDRPRFVEAMVDDSGSGTLQALHVRHVGADGVEAALRGERHVPLTQAAAPSDRDTNGTPGFMMTVGVAGSVVAVSHGWLERHQAVRRTDPILLASVEPQQRIWFDLPSGAPIGTGTTQGGDVRNDLQASRVTCFANRSGPGNDLVLGFALAHGCRLAYAEDQAFDDTPGTALVWGILRGSDRVVSMAAQSRRSYLYCDHAYFNRGHLRNYRIILNGHSTTTLRRCPDDRTAALNVTLKPWRASGAHILVCPPTDHFLRAHGSPNWVMNTLSTLRRATDRPIVVRAKPKVGEPSRSLDEDLDNCHALVTHSSNAAVEAVVAGIPVFVDPACAAIGVGSGDLSSIEAPAMPDRTLWLANLAYNQFSFEEVMRGAVLSVIRDYWDMEALA